MVRVIILSVPTRIRLLLKKGKELFDLIITLAPKSPSYGRKKIKEE